MKTNSISRAACAVMLTLTAVPAFAGGTTAGSPVSNTATVDYDVGGVDQPDVSSNTTTFVVDRKIDVTVASLGDVTVIPSQLGRVVAFTVTNNSNSVSDFSLALAEAGVDVTSPGVSIFVESNAVADGYQALTDVATFIDELGIDQTRTVYVVGDILSTALNGQSEDFTLTATSQMTTVALTGVFTATPGVLAPAAASETNVNSADDATFIDTVFADAAGDSDAQYDGKHSDTGQFDVVTATLALTKSHKIVTDPFNCTVAGDASSCTTSPKAVPGAVVEYCLDLNNSGAAAADSISIGDVLPANTSFVANSIRTGATDTDGDLDLTECDSGSGTAEDDDSADADDGPAQAGGNIDTLTETVTVTIPTVASGSRAKALFRVTID